MKLQIKIYAFFFLSVLNVSAQNSSFKKVYSTYDGQIYDFIQTSNNSFAFVGNRVDLTTLNQKSIFYKTNSHGNLLWASKIYDSVPSHYNDNTVLYSLIEASNKYYYCIGAKTNFLNPTSANSNGTVSKIDSLGNIIWIKEYFSASTTPTENQFISLIETNDNNLVLLGSNINAPCLIKLDFSGNILWYKKLSIGVFQFIKKTTNGDLIIAGSSSTTLFISKIDIYGNLLWSKNYKIPGIFQFKATFLDLDLNENLFIGGDLNYLTTNTHPYLIKLDSLGNKIFVKEYAHNFSIMEGLCGKVTSTGDLIFGMEPEGIKFGFGSQLVLSKIDNNGNLIYSLLKEKNSHSYPYKLKLMNDNNIGVLAPLYDSISKTLFLKLDENENYSCANDSILNFSTIDTTITYVGSSYINNFTCFSNDLYFYVQNLDIRNYTFCENYNEINNIEVEISIPNIFTPNNDNANDYFYIDYKGAETFDIAIYNRWGILQFKSKDKNLSWNGKNKENIPANEGVYFYVLQIGSKTYKGFVQLLR